MSEQIKFDVHHVFDAAKAASHLNWVHIDQDGNYTLIPASATRRPETAQNPATGNPLTPSTNNDRPSANGGDE